jgi:hypothetical protein
MVQTLDQQTRCCISDQAIVLLASSAQDLLWGVCYGSLRGFAMGRLGDLLWEAPDVCCRQAIGEPGIDVPRSIETKRERVFAWSAGSRSKWAEISR